MEQDPTQSQPPPQAPSDPLAELRAARDESNTPPPAPMAPSKAAPSNEGMSVGGFAENVMGQLHEIGKGLISTWPTAIKSGVQLYKYGTDPFESQDIGTHFLDSVKDTVSHVASGIAGSESDYAKHGWRVLYEKPITPVIDAMTVLSLGGGIIGKAGKLSGGISRAGMAADDVAKLGQMSLADKVATLGDHVANIPGQIGKAVAEAPLRAVGINPDSIKAMRLYEGESKAWGNQAKFDLKQKFDPVFNGLNQAEKEALDKMAMEGTNAAERAAFPRSAAALDQWKQFLSEREASLGPEGRNLLEEGTLDDAVAKKYSKRVKGDTSAENVAAAKREIGAMAAEDRPVYTPAIEGKEHSLMDIIRGKDEMPSGSGTGFLKPYKGTSERISDPTVYMRKGAEQFYNVEQKLRFLDNVVRDKNLVRQAVSGDKTLADMVDNGFYRKHLANEVRAQAAGLRELKTAEGAKPVEAVSKFATDPEVQKYIGSLKQLAAKNDTVGKYLKYAFTIPTDPLSRFLKVYDKVIGLFKLSGTVASPRWHVANVVGDAVLSTMAGEYGLHWPLMKKALGNMPPFLREGGKYVAMEIGDFNAKYVARLSDLTQAADDLARRGVWTREVAGKFKQAAGSFAAGEQTLEEFVNAVGKAHTELPNWQTKLQQIDEQIVRGSKKLTAMDAEIDALKKELAEEYSKTLYVNDRAIPAGSTAKMSSQIDALYEARQNLVADRRSKLIQSGEMEAQLPQMQKYAEVSRQAIERGNQFLGDYLSLGPVERGVFRRVVPFYAWTKAMAKLTFTLPFVAPKTAFFWHQWSQALMTMAGDKQLPDYMATYAPVGSTLDKQGRPALIWVDATSVSHFGKFFQTRFGDVPIPKLLAFWKENPILQTGYKLAGGRDEFYWAGKPMNGQVWVSAGDGEVKRFRPDGKIETVVPQAPVVKTISHMFPAVQLHEQLMTPYDINKGPALNPNGTYRFGKELWQRIVETLGPKTMVRSREDIINSDQRNVQHTLKDLQHMYRFATPDEREYIRGVFEDYQKGMFRRMKTGA